MDFLWTSSDKFLNDRNRESIPDEHRIRTVKHGKKTAMLSLPLALHQLYLFGIAPDLKRKLKNPVIPLPWPLQLIEFHAVQSMPEKPPDEKDIIWTSSGHRLTSFWMIETERAYPTDTGIGRQKTAKNGKDELFCEKPAFFPCLSIMLLLLSVLCLKYA